MPKELMAIAQRTCAIRDYDERPLKQGEVRIRSRLSAEKHGTMLAVFDDARTRFPFNLGNMSVGMVEEVSPDISKFKPGDRVYGYLPIRETHTVSQDSDPLSATGVWLAPKEIGDEALVCIDPAAVALMGAREGHLRLGDRVAIFGTGAIGLFAVQMAKLSGCSVIAVEPIEKRRLLAKRFGADHVVDPSSGDASSRVRDLTGGKGVDIALEVSGNYQVLQHAIRATRYGGAIVPVSWYHGEARGLNLGEEFHVNRQALISGARTESEPYRDYPLWDRKRLYETVVELFGKGLLTAEGVLDPIVGFKEAVEAYKLIDERPSECVKLGVTYG